MKEWLIKKAIEYSINLLGFIADYFETAKRKKQELEKYQQGLKDKQLTEEQKRANIIDFVD